MPDITKLGKYLIRRELGKGAMGIVYEGFDPLLERVVAIKTIRPQQLVSEHAADIMARFKREAQSAGRLNHPGIVAVYDYGEAIAEDDSTMMAGTQPATPVNQRMAFIAMEFVKGRELREYFESNERFALADVARLMGEILAALGHAHSHGVVHRDMKPANLMVLEDGRVKIADFGIARVEKSELTQVGTVMGTPSYMSPEQFNGHVIDGRSDLFSCGVILYQFLTGEKPFTGTTTTIMYKVLQEEPLAPSLLNTSLPPAFDAVVKKAIAKVPDQRFQNAAEFAAAINAALVSSSAKSSAQTDATVIATAPQKAAAPASPTAPASPPPPPSLPPQPPSSASVKPPKTTTPAKSGSHMPLMIGAGALLVLVATVGAYFLYGKDRAGTAPAVASTAASAANPPAKTAAPVAAAVTAPSALTDTQASSGLITVSALGLVNPKDPRFGGDQTAAQNEARADVKRQMIEKVLGLYVTDTSLNKNYDLIEKKLLSQSGTFIKSTFDDGTPTTGKDGLIGVESRAAINVRDVQKALNQLSKDERIEFIRNNGDPKVALKMTVTNAESQMLPPARSQLAENVVKERIKSFGFRIVSNDGEAAAGPNAKKADFLVIGEAKIFVRSMTLPSSGLTFSKTGLTSWTLKAIDNATGEEIYLNTVIPKAESWNTEDLALTNIGKLMGDEFSKNFFLEHFNFGVRKTSLSITGLPDGQAVGSLLRELRGFRRVLDAQVASDKGEFVLQLAEGSSMDVLNEAIIKPLNAKMGQTCFTLTSATDTDIKLNFVSACAAPGVRSKLESTPPASLIGAPGARGKPLLKGVI